MKAAVIICRVLLGLGFVVFGANILVPFLPMPMPEPGSLHAQFFTVMMPTHWMAVVGLFQLVGGVFVLLGGTTPLGLCLLAPVLVNILCFHILIDGGAGMAPGLVFSLLELFLIYAYRNHFAPLFSFRAKPAAECISVRSPSRPPLAFPELVMKLESVVCALNLKPLEPEGGFFRRTFASAHVVATRNGARPGMSAIYYALDQHHFSYLHRLTCDEVYHFYAGAPAQLSLLLPSGEIRSFVLGKDFAAGHMPQIVVPAGTWQTVKLLEAGDGWSLLGTTCCPGFDFADFELGDFTRLLAEFPDHGGFLKASLPNGRKPAP